MEGISINDLDITGLSALYVACHSGNKGIVQYLLSQNVNLNVKGPKNSTIFHCLAERDFPDIVDMILEKNKELIYVQDDDGNTCMHTAVVWSGIRIVQSLFEAGGEKLVRIKNNEDEDALETALDEN